jgi:hypothetical protein
LVVDFFGDLVLEPETSCDVEGNRNITWDLGAKSEGSILRQRQQQRIDETGENVGRGFNKWEWKKQEELNI